MKAIISFSAGLAIGIALSVIASQKPISLSSYEGLLRFSPSPDDIVAVNTLDEDGKLQSLSMIQNRTVSSRYSVFGNGRQWTHFAGGVPLINVIISDQGTMSCTRYFPLGTRGVREITYDDKGEIVLDEVISKNVSGFRAASTSNRDVLAIDGSAATATSPSTAEEDRKRYESLSASAQLKMQELLRNIDHRRKMEAMSPEERRNYLRFRFNEIEAEDASTQKEINK